MKLFKKLKIKDLLPPPVKVGHGEYSMILSSHDETSRANDTLMQLSLKAIEKARKADLSKISQRLKTPPIYTDIWPGEHYRLLAGFVLALKPKMVIEIGTATGLSSLCLKQYLPKKGKLLTFDLIPWTSYRGNVLTSEDFEDQRLVQSTDNLENFDIMCKYKEEIQYADLIFIDATHDGNLEKKLFENFSKLHMKHQPFIILDDIRVWSMLKMWREVTHPKLDLTSFGHWSGTGLVHFCDASNSSKD